MTVELDAGDSSPGTGGDAGHSRLSRFRLWVLRRFAQMRASTYPATARGPMAEGFIGSLLVLFGSIGVGWLLNISPITRHAWVIPLRTEPIGVVLATTALTLGCWIMFRAWLRLGRALSNPDRQTHDGKHDGRHDGRWGPGALKTVNIATALWSAPQLLALPIFSRDVFAYLNQGRQVIAGQDPYTSGVSSLENWFHLGTDITWAESETPYGPLFLWLEAAVMRMTPEQPDLAIFLFRLACAAGVVMIMVYVPKIARLHGVDGARAQWIAVANPLLIISFISSAHNDAIMVGFALAGVYAAAHGRGVLATLLVTVSIGIKPITIVLLPFIGLLWAGPGASWRRRFFHWGVTAAIAGGVMVAVGLVQGFGFGWLSVLAGTGTGSVFWSPVGIVEGWSRSLLEVFGLPSEWVSDSLKLGGRILSVIVVLVLMFKGSDKHAVQRMMWAFTALVVLSPIIQPWYLLWLLPFFAVTGIRQDWQFKWVVFTVAFFLAFGAFDQLSIWQFLEMDQQMIALSLAISWLAILWMGFFDRGTRWVVWEGWNLPFVTRFLSRRATEPG